MSKGIIIHCSFILLIMEISLESPQKAEKEKYHMTHQYHVWICA